jgi:hypothetical protein
MSRVQRREFLLAAGALPALAASVPLIALGQARPARIGFLAPRQRSVFLLSILKRRNTSTGCVRSCPRRSACRVELVVEAFSTLPYDVESAVARSRAAGAPAVVVLDSPSFLINGKELPTR